MGIHKTFFLIESTLFTLGGVACLAAPDFFLALCYDQSVGAEVQQHVKPLIQLIGALLIMIAGILCTLAPHVTSAACRALALSHAIFFGVEYYLATGDSPIYHDGIMYESFGHIVIAAILVALSLSAPSSFSSSGKPKNN